MKKERLPETRPQLLLIDPTPQGSSGWRLEYRRMRSYRIFEHIDVGFIELSDTPASNKSVQFPTSSDAITVGEPAAICGYPFGSDLLGSRETERFGPVVQQGHVAAISPFDGPNHPGILLDIPTGRGISGGPVFRVATGEVIGMVDRANSRLTLAITLRAERRRALLQDYDYAPSLAGCAPGPDSSRGGRECQRNVRTDRGALVVRIST